MDDSPAHEVIRATFASQGRSCRKLGSPFTALVVECLGQSLDLRTLTGRKVLGWVGDTSSRADAVPLRLAGALHALVRAGLSPQLAGMYPPHASEAPHAFTAAVMDAIRVHDERVAAFLDSPPQTNEIGRAGLLYPGLMTIAEQTGLPLAIYEIGASAGLNLLLDRFRYTLGNRSFGDAGSAIHLRPSWTGEFPHGKDPVIIQRRGCDLAPIDITDATARERLMAYIWPDQRERVERTTAAIALAVADPPPIDRADAAAWVEAMTASAPAPGSARVLMHSITAQYFPAETQQRIAAAMERAGAIATLASPLAWLSFELEGDVFALRLRLWPHGIDCRLATGDPHGWQVNWFGDREN